MEGVLAAAKPLTNASCLNTFRLKPESESDEAVLGPSPCGPRDAAKACERADPSRSGVPSPRANGSPSHHGGARRGIQAAARIRPARASHAISPVAARAAGAACV